jgi:hypothetical protein
MIKWNALEGGVLIGLKMGWNRISVPGSFRDCESFFACAQNFRKFPKRLLVEPPVPLTPAQLRVVFMNKRLTESQGRDSAAASDVLRK